MVVVLGFLLGDFDLDRIATLIAHARTSGADLLVLPDAALGGYLEDLRNPDPATLPPALPPDHPQCTSRLANASCTRRATSSRHSTLRYSGWACSSTTTKRSRNRPAENQVVLASSNLTGALGGMRFLGQAKVVGPGGDILARTWSKAGIAMAELDIARRVLHHLGERKPDAYRCES